MSGSSDAARAFDDGDLSDDGSGRDRYLWNSGVLAHPPYIILRAWVEDRLESEEEEQLERHFALCPTCAAEARDLRGFTDEFDC